MTETLRLPLKSPVAITATRRRIWIADQDSSSLAVFEPASGQLVSRVAVDDKPVAISAAAGFVAAALASGVIIAYDPDSGKELWRGAASSGNLQLRPAPNHIWIWDGEASAFMVFDVSGIASRFDAQGVTAFAPGANGVYWLSAAGILGFRPQTLGDSRTAPLSSDIQSTGAMVVCANALWLSVPNGLLLLDLHSLERRTTIKAPEGPVSHLICDDGRLFGGSRGVFLLDPAADARARPLAVTPQSPLSGLAVAGEKLWALESAEPLVHILDVP
jgi:hypothetical protein